MIGFMHQTFMELNTGLDAYFQFYNHERPHQSLKDKKPAMTYYNYESQRTT